mgnify:CR=1 FL=1
MTVQTLVIGAGPAGYTAAVYAARAGLAPVLIEGPVPGGQLTITLDVENYPPFSSTTGPELMETMRAHASHAGADVRTGTVCRLDIPDKAGGAFTATLDDGTVLAASTVILATGAEAKWLGLASETAFQGRGVSACATCDGFFFRGQKVAVVGGGNTAAEEALYLAGLAAEVHLVHRRDTLRADAVLQERLFARPNITIHWNRTVSEILGDTTGVTGLRLAGTAGHTEDLEVAGVFIAIGHTPQVDLVRGAAALTDAGTIALEGGSTRTSVPGLFAAGDVADPVYRQAITSAGMGCMAALDAQSYLQGL